jgi:PAS domain-containing protein
MNQRKVYTLTEEMIKRADSKFENLLEEYRKVLINQNVVWRWDNEGVIVSYHPLQGGVVFLNPTMAKIFSYTEKGATTEELVKRMRDEYPDVSVEQIERDVIDGLKILFVNGFIKIGELMVYQV